VVLSDFPLTFTVDVWFATHDQVKAGDHDAVMHQVTVLADFDDVACLVAAQMVGGHMLDGQSVMSTATQIVSCVA
jgi:hypothetical protein